MADFFVIASAQSRPQVAAIVDHVETILRRAGSRRWHVEGQDAIHARGARRRPSPSGADGFSWVLLDCGDLVVHLFDPHAREFYQLERLWGDAPRVPFEPHV